MTTPPASQARATFIPADKGETLRIVGDRVRILADAQVSGGALSVVETSTPPGQGPPLHVHQREDEYFYIMDGRAKFSLDGKIIIAEPGAFLVAPRGSVHTFVSLGPQHLRMIVFVTPSGLEVPFRANAALFLTKPDAGPAEIGAIFAKHDLAFVGPPLTVD